jgi:two-component system OmpR family response regulator
MQLANGNSGIVMVVDDESALRDVCARALSHAGFQVVAAADGHEAMALMPLYDVALVLLDVSMPGMDGFEALRRMRAAWPELSVVFMTGYFEGDVGPALIAAGADAVIPKPFELTQLTRQVRRLIERHRMAIEARQVA